MLNRLIAVFILVIVLLQAAHSQEDLLNFLIEQNEAAKEKIKTAEYKVKWTQNLEVKEGLRHNEGFGEVKMKGDWRLSTQECNASVPATGWKQKQTQRMVINDKYLAYWPTVGNAYIYQDDHQSLKELSDHSKLYRDRLTTPDMFSFNFAFGGEKNATFKEMMKLHPDKIKWTAEESKRSNGDTVYLIKRYSPFMNDPTKPDAVWTIDPQKGFLVTQAEFYSKAGNVWITRKTEPKEIGSGIWIPASYQEHRYGNPKDIQERKDPESTTTIQLEDISINDEISDDYFVIESILPVEHRESTTLFRKGLDGNTEAYVYKYGRYILRKNQHNIEHLAELLIGKPLPSFDNIQINYTKEELNSEPIIVCFWDMLQRPSRNCIMQLSKKVKELKAKDIIILTVQASKVEQAKLDEWIKDNNIHFPVGMIQNDVEKTRFTWGVKALPWLILTDKEHIVQAEGFNINELDHKITTLREK